MNIAVFNEFFPPRTTGGTEIFLKALCEYLESEGFGITLFVSDAVRGETNFKTYKLKSSPFRLGHMRQFPGVTLPWMFYNKALRNEISEIYTKERIDLSYINNCYHLSMAPFQVSLKRKVPMVLDIHDFWTVCFSKDKYKNGRLCDVRESSQCASCLMKKFKFPFPIVANSLATEALMRRELIEQVKIKIVHSNFMKEEMKLNKYETEVIPYPFMGKVYDGIKRANTKLKLLFVGRLTEQKGADLLLPLARYLKDQDIDFEINVLGEGKLKNSLKRKDLNIHTRGFVDGYKKDEYFINADILIAPSKWSEPFGLVALEAMAYQVPILTLDKSGGLVETVKKNCVGVICGKEHIGSKIMVLKDSLEKYRKNCRKNIKKYDKKKIFKRYKKLFESFSGSA